MTGRDAMANGSFADPAGRPDRAAPSARGLFRATGKVGTVDRPREEDDFYPTPPEPTRAILAAEAARLAEFPLIWEPACGDGAMVREIRAAGHRVVATDLRDRGCDGASVADFMAMREPLAPAILTNPPYDLCNWRDGRARWITHALDTLGVSYMALLLSWNWPAAGGLSGVWARNPPARVYLMRWKIDFTGAGAPPMLSGWFIWDREARGECVLRMLDRGMDARQAGFDLGNGEDGE